MKNSISHLCTTIRLEILFYTLIFLLSLLNKGADDAKQNSEIQSLLLSGKISLASKMDLHTSINIMLLLNFLFRTDLPVCCTEASLCCPKYSFHYCTPFSVRKFQEILQLTVSRYTSFCPLVTYLVGTKPFPALNRPSLSHLLALYIQVFRDI